jgi:hypothetical protein
VHIHVRFVHETFLHSKTSPTLPQFLKEEAAKKKKEQSERVQVDAAFFRQLWKIMRILIPSVFSQEVRCIKTSTA